MARKSRKQIAVEEPVIECVSSEVFSTAIYARLSVENSGKSEKVDVIANQIEICKSYIAEPVSYTHLDVYKRQGKYCLQNCSKTSCWFPSESSAVQGCPH